MPASAADPIASSLKRTFSSLHNGASNGGSGGTMGLMRGGNSSSIMGNGDHNNQSLDSRLQASSRKGLLMSNVQFDAPTRYVGGIISSDSSTKSRYIILNPQKQVGQQPVFSDIESAVSITSCTCQNAI